RGRAGPPPPPRPDGRPARGGAAPPADGPAGLGAPAGVRAAGRRRGVLAAALHLPLRTVRSRTARAERFVWLERQVPPREAEAVEQLGLKGVHTDQEPRRIYAHHGLPAQGLCCVGAGWQVLAWPAPRRGHVLPGP